MNRQPRRIWFRAGNGGKGCGGFGLGFVVGDQGQSRPQRGKQGISPVIRASNQPEGAGVPGRADFFHGENIRPRHRAGNIYICCQPPDKERTGPTCPNATSAGSRSIAAARGTAMPHMSFPVSRRSPTLPTRRQRAESPNRCISWCSLFSGEVMPVQSTAILASRNWSRNRLTRPADSGCHLSYG